MSRNRSWDRQEELGDNVVTDEASAARKCLEAMVAFRVVHIQGCTLTDTLLATAGKGCDLGPTDSLIAIHIESYKLAATKPPRPER